MVDQEKIHNQCLSDDPEERKHALEQLEEFFSLMPDKEQAWNDLHRLTNDEDSSVRSRAASALGFAFFQVPDKQQAWNDLIKLTNDKDSDVRSRAAAALHSLFSQVPDKEQAWNDLLRLTNNEDSDVRSRAAKALGFAFSQVPDKQQAWNDLIKLTNDEDSDVRFRAASVLSFAFTQMSDKQQAWNDLLRLITNSKDNDLRSRTASSLGFLFSQVSDKEQAWNNLHRLTNNKNSDLRSFAASALGPTLSQVSDKQQAWNDLHRLINDEDSYVRSRAVEALIFAFSQVPDKQQAWNDLIKLTNDEDFFVMFSATEALGSLFFQVPDKQQAWNDLIKLTNDEDSFVRSRAAEVLGSLFSQVPDKQQAWNDLLRLTNDKDSYVRSRAAESIGYSFSNISDKQQAWNDLLRLTNDEDSFVRSKAAEALGSLCSQVSDKQQVRNDLIKLTNNEYSDVRSIANHSLGKVSIFMASQAETDEDYKRELEKAIEFFRIAAKESSYDNPAQFCLPFYRSFYTIIFKKQEVREEVDKYLGEAKSAIEGSESKKQLFEAVQTLAEALKEVQNMGNLDLSRMKDELNSHRKYCDHAAELMKCTDEKAPVTTEVLRRGLSLFIEEIQDKAKAVCKQTKGTPAESLGLGTNKAAKELSGFHDSWTLDVTLNEQIEYLKKYCGFILPGKKSQFHKMIEETKNMNGRNKLEWINKINEYVLNNSLFPRIENINISDRIKETIRIATVQLEYTLSEDFPFRIKNEDKEQMKNKILNAVRKAKEAEVNVLCFPELCICEEWLPEIRNRCQEMIVISGTYYDEENHNICRIITDFDVEIPPQLKIFPSNFEDSDITEQGMIPGEKVLNVYESQFGTFAVLICRDFGNFVSSLEGIADVIFCPSYNQANGRFHTIANNHVTNSPSYLVISNTAQYGGTSIFGRMRNSFFGALVQKGCKDRCDTSYKLCEIEKGKEGMIVADFNLIYKSPPLQTPINPKDDIRPVKKIRKIMF